MYARYAYNKNKLKGAGGPDDGINLGATNRGGAQAQAQGGGGPGPGPGGAGQAAEKPGGTPSGGEETEPPFMEKLFKSIMFGLINSIIVLPVMISFTQIIFRDPFFRPKLPELTKLVLCVQKTGKPNIGRG